MALAPTRLSRHQASRLQLKPASRHMVLNICVFVVVVIVLGTQIGNLSVSLPSLRQANMRLVLFACLAVAGSFGAAALSYQVLAGSKLRLRQTVAVQIASGLANRILPAGLGSLGLYATYYRKHGYSLTAATALVTTNNILGVIGNVGLILGVLLFHPNIPLHVQPPHLSLKVIVLVLALCIIVLGTTLAVMADRIKRLWVFIRDSLRQVWLSLLPSTKTALALSCNLLLTSCNALVLSLTVTAVGATLSWPLALLVLSLGTAVGAVVPTPGGIGGVEAGLLSGLVACGVAASSALAAVLLYRVLAYWLPIVPRLIVFQTVEKRYL